MINWSQMPDKDELINSYQYDVNTSPLKTNAHLHTPYSFSAFSTVDQAIDMAVNEDIRVLGINDFNTITGYAEWAQKTLENGIFPLFNIEFIGFSVADGEKGIRINDPGNPGRIYISGKGLSVSAENNDDLKARLEMLRKLSNEHVAQMTVKVNQLLKDSAYNIDFNDMLLHHTKGQVRERHLAKMIRQILVAGSDGKTFVLKLSGMEEMNIESLNEAELENLIRNKMLKKGGSAFVPENPESFLDPGAIFDLIIGAGGIPTYPFLADMKNGDYTDFESDPEKASEYLLSQGYCSVELIPGRNDSSRLTDYVNFLDKKGFIISFGTEHNTPALDPLTVRASGNTELNDYLLRISYEGACIIAAHQYLFAREGRGYLNNNNSARISEKDMFIALGNALIRYIQK